MKALLESSLRERFDITFLNTNFRSSNAQRGRLDFSLVRAFFRFILQLYWKLATTQPRIVYYFVTATRLGWLGRDIWCIALSRLLGAKVVIHMRAAHFRRNYEDAPAPAKALIRLACSLVSVGIVQAHSLRDQFAGLLPEERIVVVHNSIDTELFANDEPFHCHRRLVLFLGHLSHAKGYCDLLKVIPRIVSKYPDVCFTFAGNKVTNETNVHFNQLTGERLNFENPDEVFRSCIENRHEQNYRYLGIVTGAEKLDLIRRCSFIVLPSYSEGFSMAVLEAMGMAKPVVCTPVGALGEIVVDRVNGMLVQPGDLEALEGAIEELLADDLLRDRIADTNHVYVRQKFRIDSIAASMGDIFAQLLTAGGTKHIQSAVACRESEHQ
jgi:glycosyltransferase involved in cell wall biosynthesis